MIEDEWPRNTCDEVDSIGSLEKREEMRSQKKKEERHWERAKERDEYEEEREKGSRAAIDYAYFAFVVSYPVVSRSSG